MVWRLHRFALPNTGSAYAGSTGGAERGGEWRCPRQRLPASARRQSGSGRRPASRDVRYGQQQRILTIVADSACTGLPEDAHRRTYDAAIAAASNPTAPTDTTFHLTVSGASFVDGYNDADINVAGDYASYGLDDLHGDPGVIERLAANEETSSNRFVAFGGGAGLSLGDGSTIVASLVDVVSCFVSGP
jgi:hypothetical protein